MNPVRLRAAGVLACTTAAVAAVVAPSVVVTVVSSGAGAGGRADLDLVLVSAAVGLGYARFLRGLLAGAPGGSRASGTEADVWLSAVHGLVVLLPAASGLPAALLHLTAEQHAGVVEAEWPVLVGWAAASTLAVLLAEGARRLSLRWLRRS